MLTPGAGSVTAIERARVAVVGTGGVARFPRIAGTGIGTAVAVFVDVTFAGGGAANEGV
jgi:hypothetical protein